MLRLGGVAAGIAALGTWLRLRSVRPVEAAAAQSRGGHAVPSQAGLPDLVVVTNGEPAALVQTALRELGGIERFVSRGDVVLLKPNIGWDRTAEQAANTNPDVVAEVVRQCRRAGAGKVIVTDVSCNDPRRCFRRSGIAEAAAREGAEVLFPDPDKFREVDLQGEVLKTWPVFEPFLTADKIINLPIAKHHSLTGATLGLKNWYGILGGQRNQLHQRVHESLADLANFIRPTLTMLDAYRVLIRNGPTGGSLEDVVLKKTMVAGTDPVAIDAYAAKTFWDLEAEALPYLRLAGLKGLGNPDFSAVRSKMVRL
jgi:uncharacterized protein (DUF362 family)